MATKTLEETKEGKTLSVVTEFFKQFHKWCGPSLMTPSVAELEKYLAKDLQMYNNGQLVVKGAANYLERLQKFQKKYYDFKISEPLEKPLVHGNQGAIYYQLDLTTHGKQHKQVYIMGLFTIEDGKIKRWIEVTNEKGVEHWDK